MSLDPVSYFICIFVKLTELYRLRGKILLAYPLELPKLVSTLSDTLIIFIDFMIYWIRQYMRRVKSLVNQ